MITPLFFEKEKMIWRKELGKGLILDSFAMALETIAGISALNTTNKASAQIAVTFLC